MKDINKPIRKAFYVALNGNLSFNGVDVPVSDELLKIADKDKDYYVILSTQTSRDDSTKSSYDREATIIVDIVTKVSKQTATKDIADSIADEILTLLFPAPNVHSLTAPATWQFLNLSLSDDRHLSSVSDTNTIVRRLLQFTLRVVQN